MVLAALLVLFGVVALSDDSPTPTNDAGQATPAPTTTFSLPTVATTLATTSTAPPTTIEKVTVPRLVGLRLARAKDRLADRGLTTKATYKATGRYPAGTVISQSRKAGADVLPDTTISLVVAKAPPPPPSTAPPAPPQPRRHGTAIPPTLTSAFAPMPRTTTAKGAQATGPTMCPARCGCCRPTHSSWMATTTMAGAASRDEQATLNEHPGAGRSARRDANRLVHGSI